MGFLVRRLAKRLAGLGKAPWWTLLVGLFTSALLVGSLVSIFATGGDSVPRALAASGLVAICYWALVVVGSMTLLVFTLAASSKWQRAVTQDLDAPVPPAIPLPGAPQEPSDDGANVTTVEGLLQIRWNDAREGYEAIVRTAGRARQKAGWIKSALIVLGAVSAGKAVVDRLTSGTASNWSIAVFALVGLATASLAGLDAAFKFDNRTSELSTLGGACRSLMRSLESEWFKVQQVEAKFDEAKPGGLPLEGEAANVRKNRQARERRARETERRNQKARVDDLLDTLTKELNTIYAQAERLGVRTPTPRLLKLGSPLSKPVTPLKQAEAA